MSQTLNNLTQTLPKFSLSGPENPSINGITSDSRQVKPGYLFVAYKGIETDGHNYLDSALKNGAVAVVVEADSAVSVAETVTCLTVPNGRSALAHLSAAWHNYPAREMIMVGITGTDGKTSTINLIYSILKQAGKKVSMISTVNAVIGDEVLDTGLHTTTPDSPDVQRYLSQMREAGVEICLLETTSHGLAQHRITACYIDWAVITNITHEHLDIHGSLAEYRLAKARLFQMASQGVILNADDWSFQFLREKISPKVDIISYGIENEATLQAKNITLASDVTHFEVTLKGEDKLVKSPLVGAFNISNILAALALTVEGLGIDIKDALTALRDFQGVSGRMERISQQESYTAIVDFAHTPNALRRALETVRALTDKRIIAIFGCAGLRDLEKRTLMGQISAELAHITIITAEDPRTENLDAIIDVTAQAMQAKGAVEAPAGPQPETYPAFIRVSDRGRAIYLGTQLAQPGDIVIALGKGHEQSMCFGVTEYPWDDRDAMRSALAGAPLLTLPSA